MRPSDIAKKILLAKKRVLFMAPGLDSSIASALVNIANQIGKNSVTIILDVDENVVRLGYGAIDEIKMLQDANLSVRQQAGCRIGVLLCDYKGWAFSLPAMMVEDQSLPVQSANGFVLNRQQVDEMFKSISIPRDVTLAPKTIEEAPREDNPTESEPVVNVGLTLVSVDSVKDIKNKIDENPPQPFNLSRQVKVYSSYLQFVELEIVGAHVSRHTINIPKKFKLLLTKDKDTQERLRSSFQLIDSNKQAASQKLIDEINNLRERYLQNLRSVGKVILRSNRKDFDEALNEIMGNLDVFKNDIKTQLSKEVIKTKKNLVKALVPVVKKNPPPDLLRQTSTPITVDKARHYLEHELDKTIPDIDKLISDIKINCLFKDVTLEMLKNDEFQKAVAEAFPLEPWARPFTEFEAAKAVQPSLI